jgi:hypothetical protein
MEMQPLPTARKVIRIASSQLRRAFANWLATECQSGARLIVLEGLTKAGKTTLTGRPFPIGAGRSLNIEIDEFFPQDVPLKGVYPEAIDRPALQASLRAGLVSAAPVVVIEGPMAWPLVQPIAEVPLDCIRRVYLKRMRRLQPHVWSDEDFINDPTRWPPIDFYRSIYRYHMEQLPWLDANLVLERIATKNEPP